MLNFDKVYEKLVVKKRGGFCYEVEVSETIRSYGGS